ncbi:DUF4136 domain-containing protein [Dyella jiangningensis]|uniref:DUF4136 domain-containing protein n=1 Tax=Dyella jiangningensis TaxID=1379159 RepID=A0A328P4E9_9GAMM|nr:hypothetical protein [Dyella jiangningensis]RAO77127.1 hypothetical protein CA260_04320 [Dyella jiangningensis]
MKLLRLFVIAVSVVLCACSTVSVTNQWRDPSWAGPPASNVVVVGISRSDTMRRVFEDTFAQQLQAAGVQAAASYTQIPPGNGGSVRLRDLVKGTGAQAVLVTRVERVQQKVNVTPSGPYYGGFYGWYGGAWASTPDIHQYEVVTLETSVWDARSEKLIWTVTTENVATSDIPKTSTQLAQTLIPKMKADGVLR